MKKIFTILILFTISVFAFGQFGKTGGGKISVKEADGSPSGSNIDTVKVNNGSLTITDNVATINITAAAASSTDSLNMSRATIPADSVMDLTSTQTATGEKTFESIVLPSGCVGTDQVFLNSLGASDLGPSSVAESEANWAGMDSDSIASRLVGKIDSTHVKDGSLINSDLKSGTIQASRLATGAVTETKLGTSSVTEEKIKWSSVNADSAFSSVSAKTATQISDSLGRYTTNSLLDTTKADTSQWGKFVRDHQSSGGAAGDSLFDTITIGHDARNVDGRINFTDEAGATNEITSDGDTLVVTGAANGFRVRGGPIRVYKASPTSDETLFNVATSDDASRFMIDEDGDVSADGIGFFTGGIKSTGSLDMSIADYIIFNKPGGYYGGYAYGSLTVGEDDGLRFVTGITNYANNNLIITTYDNKTKDHDHETDSINPTLFIHSATNVDNYNTEWGGLAYTGTGSGGGDFVISTGAGDIQLKPVGNVEIGAATAVDQQSPDLIIYNDADSDGTATTSEALTISLTANATPTLATWGFTSTQGAGYTFDRAMSITTPSAGSQVGLSVKNTKSSGNIFNAINNANGAVGDSSFSINSAGQVGIKGAPNSSYSLYVNSGDVYAPKLGINTAPGSNILYVSGSSRFDGSLFMYGGGNSSISGVSNVSISIQGGDTKNTWNTTGYLLGNSTVADQQSPDLIIYNDADSDGSATTSEALTISLTANADPTLARWNFASTQGRGYSFNKNLYLQSDSTADHDIFVGNATFSRMNAGDANFTTSSSADLKENFQEIEKPNLDSLKFYTYTWKKEALGWIDLKTIPDSVTTFAWSVDTLQDGTFDSTQVFWKIPNPEKKRQAEINKKAEARAKETKYGMKSEDWDAKVGRADSKAINWQEVAIKFYRLVLDHETKIKDLEARVSKLEGN